MLHGNEESLSVRREFRPTQFRSLRASEEVLRDGTTFAFGLGNPDAVVDTMIGEAVGRNPQPPLRVEHHVVRVREPSSLGHAFAVLGALRGILWIASQNERVPFKRIGGMIELANLSQPLAGRAGIDIVLSDLDEVLLAKAAFSLGAGRHGLGQRDGDARLLKRQDLLAVEVAAIRHDIEAIQLQGCLRPLGASSWNQISIGLPWAAAGSASFTSSAKFF